MLPGYFARVVPVPLQRFLVTGVLNTLCHAVVAVAMIELAHAGPTLANVVAFVIATAMSYLINTLWSFSHRISGVTLLRFILVSLVGVGITAAVAHTAAALGAHYLVGILCVALTNAPVTYLLHRFWTYRR